MTEAEWQACDDSRVMLKNLHGRATDRKLRLFTVASCRRIPPFVQHERLCEVADVGERYADGRATYRDMVGMAKNSEWVGLNSEGSARDLAAAWCASAMNVWYWKRPLFRTRRVVGRLLAYDGGEACHQAELLRCIFGNPFRPVAFAPAWRSDAAVSLARKICETRDFGAMPILADSLQDAGCDSDEVLTHCRGAGPHVRGCWVVDLVLGKS